MDWEALKVTMLLAAATTITLAVVALPVSLRVATAPVRFKRWLQTLLLLPLVLPPTVLGYYLLVLFAPHGVVGRTWDFLFDSRLAFSFPAIVLASILFNLPFTFGPFINSFEGIDQRLIENGKCLGLSRVQILWYITLPLAASGILTGMLLTFAHTIGEFGVVLMVGGNVAGETRTMSLSLYDDLMNMNYPRANATAMALVLFSFATILTLHILVKSRRSI